jgi:hypothetical protein
MLLSDVMRIYDEVLSLRLLYVLTQPERTIQPSMYTQFSFKRRRAENFPNANGVVFGNCDPG